MAINKNTDEYNFGYYKDNNDTNKLKDSSASEEPFAYNEQKEDSSEDSLQEDDVRKSEKESSKQNLNEDSSEKSQTSYDESESGSNSKKDDEVDSSKHSHKSKIENKSSKGKEDTPKSDYSASGVPRQNDAEIKDKLKKASVGVKAAETAAKAGAAAATVNVARATLQAIFAFIKSLIHGVTSFFTSIGASIAGFFTGAASAIASALSISTFVASVGLALILAIVPVAGAAAAYSYIQDTNNRRVEGNCIGESYETADEESDTKSDQAEEVINILKEHEGTKYNDGEDQSWSNGLTSRMMVYLAYKQAGVSLSKTFNEDPYPGKKIKSIDDASKGDILFFKSDSKKKPVGLLIDSEYMYQVTKEKGLSKVKIDKNKIEFIRRVITDTNSSTASSETSADKPKFSVTYIKNTSSNTRTKQVASRMWKVLKASGMTDEAASAVLANVEQESGFKVNAGGDASSGAAWGLFQMEAGRLAEMKKFCKDATGDEWNVEAQTEWTLKENFNSQFAKYSGCDTYFLYDGPGSESGHEVKYTGSYPDVDHWAWWPSEKFDFEKFAKGKDIDELTEVFCRVFERASTPNMKRRKSLAKKWYTNKTGLEIAAINADIAYDNSDDGCGQPMKTKKPSFTGPAEDLIFVQWKAPYASKEYDNGYSIGNYGCGLCSTAHAIALLTGDYSIDPIECVKQIKKHGDAGKFCCGEGSYHGRLGLIAGYYDLKAEYGKANTAENMKKALQDGGCVVAVSHAAVFKKLDGSHYSSGGHYICFWKYENGMFYVKDSGQGANGNIPYSESDVKAFLALSGEQITIHK